MGNFKKILSNTFVIYITVAISILTTFILILKLSSEQNLSSKEIASLKIDIREARQILTLASSDRWGGVMMNIYSDELLKYINNPEKYPFPDVDRIQLTTPMSPKY